MVLRSQLTQFGFLRLLYIFIVEKKDFGTTNSREVSWTT